MLQKLENTYLAILRFAVIAAAGILLIAVIILGAQSYKAFLPEPSQDGAQPQVPPQSLVDAVVVKPAQAPKAADKPASPRPEDPNQAYFVRAARAFADFVSRHNPGISVNTGILSDLLRQRAERYKEPALVAAYAKNLAEAVEKALADPNVNREAANRPAAEFIDLILNRHAQEFDRQAEEAKARRDAAHDKYLEQKAEGLRNLYLASGGFVAFLMIVFLSIFIRIERNLRHLEKPGAA